jgi:F-type H+-transporting ATPase subunit delta
MNVSEVSRRYAKALMALAKQKGQHLRARAEVDAIAKMFKADANVRSYFTNPLISHEQKKAVVQTTFGDKGLLEEVYNLMQLLVAKNRIGAFEEIAAAYDEQMDLEEGITRGSVKSAKPLTDAAKKDLEDRIHKILNKKIILTYKEDSTLLGGVVADVGGWTFDDSIETHLTKMNEDLNRRAN